MDGKKCDGCGDSGRLKLMVNQKGEHVKLCKLCSYSPFYMTPTEFAEYNEFEVDRLYA